MAENYRLTFLWIIGMMAVMSKTSEIIMGLVIITFLICGAVVLVERDKQPEPQPEPVTHHWSGQSPADIVRSVSQPVPSTYKSTSVTLYGSHGHAHGHTNTSERDTWRDKELKRVYLANSAVANSAITLLAEQTAERIKKHE